MMNAAASNTSVWPALIGLAGVIGGAVITWLLARRAAAVDRRRDGYAEAMRVLVAYTEYPFRIRRRTSDDPATLAQLASLGHDLQEQLRSQEAWVMAESAVVGEVFSAVRRALGALLADACRDAWSSPPVSSPADMNLNGWGPDAAAVRKQLERFERALACRFGWRRVPSHFGRLVGVPDDPEPVPESRRIRHP